MFKIPYWKPLRFGLYINDLAPTWFLVWLIVTYELSANLYWHKVPTVSLLMQRFSKQRPPLTKILVDAAILLAAARMIHHVETYDP